MGTLPLGRRSIKVLISDSYLVPKPLKVRKDKFDAVLSKLLATPASVKDGIKPKKAHPKRAAKK